MSTMYTRPKIGDIITLDNASKTKYVLLSTPFDDNANTIATMVMLDEIPIYWFSEINDGKIDHADLVGSPQTIYGACPAYFGTKVND